MERARARKRPINQILSLQDMEVMTASKQTTVPLLTSESRMLHEKCCRTRHGHSIALLGMTKSVRPTHGG